MTDLVEDKTINFSMGKYALLSLALGVLFILGTLQTLQLSGMYKSVGSNQQVISELKGINVGTVTASAPSSSTAPSTASATSNGIPSQVGGC